MKTKILAIEDEEDILDNIKIFLESENYEVIIAKDGIEGLKILKTTKPDLILCDIMMPRMNGYSVLSEISKDENLSHIPFIFLTAKVDKKDLRKGMELGADDYVFKPFTYEELLTAIKTRITKQKKILAKLVIDKNNLKSDDRSKVDIEENIFIRKHNKTIPIKVNKIKYIQAENQYSLVVCEENKSYLIRKSMDKWESMLPSKYFLRIHRSNLINLDYLEKIDKLKDGSCQITLKGTPTKFEISRRYLKNFKKSCVRI